MALSHEREAEIQDWEYESSLGYRVRFCLKCKTEMELERWLSCLICLQDVISALSTYYISIYVYIIMQ